MTFEIGPQRHIARNMRLCLVILDMVQPYVEVAGFVDLFREKEVCVYIHTYMHAYV